MNNHRKIKDLLKKTADTPISEFVWADELLIFLNRKTPDNVKITEDMLESDVLGILKGLSSVDRHKILNMSITPDNLETRHLHDFLVDHDMAVQSSTVRLLLLSCLGGMVIATVFWSYAIDLILSGKLSADANKDLLTILGLIVESLAKSIL